jgi:hypothetical protein
MKMTALQPEEGRFDFRWADAFVGFAQANGSNSHFDGAPTCRRLWTPANTGVFW